MTRAKKEKQSKEKENEAIQEEGSTITTRYMNDHKESGTPTSLPKFTTLSKHHHTRLRNG